MREDYDVNVDSFNTVITFPMNNINDQDNKVISYKYSLQEKEVLPYENEFCLGDDLIQAVDNGEIDIYYQPQVNIKTGKIVAAEAFLRWNHPQLGNLSSDEFLSYAEENGLIIPLSELLIREACIQTKMWSYFSPIPFKIVVNLSSSQFLQTNLANVIAEILTDIKFSGNCLTLAITEDVLFKDFSKAKAIIEDLKSLDICLAIDKFGTGFSSLHYLEVFPFDFIKIDETFLKDLLSNNKTKTIVSGIIEIGKALDLGIIAQGVKSEFELEFLNQTDCDIIQGELFSCPVSIKEFESLLYQNSQQCA